MNADGITLDQIIPLSLERLEAEATVVDDVDGELFPFFEEEARAELKAIEEVLHAWDTAMTSTPLKALGRQFHTLKGAANSIGHLRIGSLAAGMKDVVERIEPSDASALRPPIIKTSIQVTETIRALLQEARAPEHNRVKKEQIVMAVQAILRLQETVTNLKRAA
jgi:chemotaxis protein histidine kinase CheA